MYGKGDSTLNVIQKGFNTVQNGTIIWKDKMNYGDVWVLGRVSLPANFSGNYVLLFEGISGPSVYGDIGLDDIVITSGDVCQDLYSFKCQNGTYLTQDQVCNFVNDCPSGEEEQNCGYNRTDFETGFNNWNETSNGLYKWVRGANVNSVGPQIDHTTGLTSGYYIYVDSDTGTSNTNSRFSSPVLRNSWSSCQVSFWYQLNGNDIGAIEVYLNVSSQRSRIARVTSQTYNQWVKTTINLGRYRSAFSLDIEAYRSFKITGNIAVDDIEFTGILRIKID